MNFNTATGQKAVLDALKRIAEDARPKFERLVVSRLNAEERQLFEAAQSLPYDEGSWFRPIHNCVVTASSLLITPRAPAKRRIIVPAAILHDIGYSFIRIRPHGQDWERKDARRQHMRLGAMHARALLGTIRRNDRAAFSPAQVREISRIVSVHDNPYLGIALRTENERRVRDADRCFVPAAINWYKDFAAKKQAGKAALTSREFLRWRIAFFFPSAAKNPLQRRYPLDASLQKFSEGGRCEPPFTKAAHRIVARMFRSRARELEQGTFLCGRNEFEQRIRRSLGDEISFFRRALR